MINRFKKFVSVFGISILMIFSFATVANAEDYVADPNQGGEAVYTTAPAQEVYTEPNYTQAPEQDYNNNYNNTYAQDYTQAPVVDNYNTDTNTYGDQNSGSYNFYDDNGQVTDNSYDTNTNTDTNTDSYGDAGEATTPTYDTSREIDDTELKDSDWDKISKKLAKSKTKGTNSSPFDYIKNSEKATGWDAFINNLNWVMCLAIACFALSIISLIVFIVFTVKKKRNKKKGLSDVSVKSEKSKSNGSHSIVEDDEEDNFDGSLSTSKSKSRHGGDDYGDDFDDDFDDVHYVKPSEKSKKKKVKQDTSEIIIPNKYKR